MNFLAHLHIASVTETSLLGNFLGDFVKGHPQGKFNPDIVQGIRLHRFVDSYTDQHVIIKSLKPLFPEKLRRFSPIALDMFWDHCLSLHWHDFEDASLEDFCRRAQLQTVSESRLENNVLPARFENVSQLAWKNKWFERYSEIETITFALQRMALRSTRMARLADTGETLLAHYELLTEQFFVLYPDVLQKSVEFITKTKIGK